MSHGNTMYNVLTSDGMHGNQPATDSHVVCLPLFHTFGATVHDALRTGQVPGPP